MTRHLHLLKLLIPLLFLACALDAPVSSTKPTIVTTTGMIADLAREIGKDSVTVIPLMGPGVDPHLYKATQGDLSRLRKADLILYNGLHLEGKMGEVLEKVAKLKPVVAVSEQIDSTLLLDDVVYNTNYDPHIWFDVSLWRETIPTVLNELKQLDPESTSYYETNASYLDSALAHLHQFVKIEIAKIPVEQRILITAHDAFNYFGRAYAIEVRGLQGISTLSEFGLKDRVELVNYIVEKKIKAVFVETSVSEKNIQSIIEGCAQRGHQVVIGGSLYSDAMGEDGTPEGTYMGMVKANVKAIVESLR